jgi:phenylpropionate dioxygenase-like ring-hydroxylating dioxygenase large terminal subunit
MFLRNAWYAAFWSTDLQDRPLGRTILNERIVVFRNASSQIAALEDRCCHRAAPLSKGELDGDYLMCGYHGLRYDIAGQCVKVPGQRTIPPNSKVRSYPVHEKWNAVWIWMGDKDQADIAKIPHLPWLDNPDWTLTTGYLHVKASYQFIADNLLDLTHVTYVHKNTLAGDPREATTPTKTERLPDGVRVGRWLLDFVPPPLFVKAGNFKGNVDRWQFVTWKPPSTIYLDIGCANAGSGAPQGDRSQGISIWTNHLITPETETSSHYLYGYARNFALNDPGMSTLLSEGSRTTFLEDVDFLEAVQTHCRGGSIDGLVDLNADAAQLQARHMLSRLISAEQGQHLSTYNCHLDSAASQEAERRLLR